jgi:hypothetical protein
VFVLTGSEGVKWAVLSNQQLAGRFWVC